ncbi:hypothetical protein HY632_01730 [Candidatus Uhrbacteria bacterium]|nr:hypothetical protein [Candidatus Uhrbacteria bacterium]
MASSATKARRATETSRPRLLWPELRKRYERYADFESRLGFIHASRTAELPWKTDRTPEEHQHERTLEMIEFLTEIGSEKSVRENDQRLREHARSTLARYGVLPITVWYDQRQRDREAPVPTSITLATSHLVSFYKYSEKHVHGLGAQDLAQVQQFLAQRLQRCVSSKRARSPRTRRVLHAWELARIP